MPFAHERWVVATCFALFCTPLLAEPAPPEDVKSIKASSLLGNQASSANHRVVDPVTAIDLLYSFSLWTPFGWYQPQSYAMLQIKIGEANAIATLNSMKDDPLFFEGVTETAGSTIKATGAALRTPIRSIAQVPMGLAKFGSA